MKKYKVLVKGNNYKIVVGRRAREFAFHTTRFIEPDNHMTAKERALEVVTGELEQIVFNNQAGSPVIEVPQFIEVESFGDHDVPGSGFTWHLEGRTGAE